MLVLFGLAVVGIAHIAGLIEGVMESESGIESVGGLAGCAEFEIIKQQLAIHGMRAVVDDFVGSFHRVFVAQVGNTLVGYDDVDRMLAVVGVGNHGNDVADGATFSD